ncbi:MAG: hypothetical protein M3Y58_08670 [Chloroflexota bacterium]|nr:hypothetical protein [Chloroflexota bacterium]
MIVPLLCGMMLILTLMRVAVPIGQPITGDPLGVAPLRFRERLRLQRTNVYMIGIVLLLGTLGGWMRAPINLIVVLATFVIISIPVQYTFTTEGIARNRVVFRRWDEFSAIADGRGRILLHGMAGSADFPLLLADDQHTAVLRLLAQTPLGVSEHGRLASSPVARKRRKETTQHIAI